MITDNPLFLSLDKGTLLPTMYSDINEAEEIEEASIWTRTGMMVKNCLQKDIIGSSFGGPIGTANETNIENLSAYIMECSILPHFGVTDYVMLYDKDIKKFLPIPEQLQNVPNWEIKRLPTNYKSNRYYWMQVCLMNRQSHLMFRMPIREARPENISCTHWPCMIRDTGRIGYNVLSVIDTGYLGSIEDAILEKVSWPLYKIHICASSNFIFIRHYISV